MDNRSAALTDVEIDVGALLSSLIRKLPYLIVFLGIVAVGTYVGLGQIPPVYKSEATVLIETGESDLTRTPDSGAGQAGNLPLDEQAIASQVQLIRSRDLAETVAKKLDLASRPEFDPTLAPPSALDEFLARYGLGGQPTDSSPEERVLHAYYDRLSVYTVDRSRVIGVDFSSTDPKLAAAAANAIAEGYIALQRDAKRSVTSDAAAFLSSQIDDLRGKVVAAEAKVEDFRSRNDLFTSGGQDAATLPEQQLADLNSQLSSVRAERVAAEAKAAQIRAALDAGGTPNVPDVVNSPLIQRLVEQQVALKSQIAQLSATLGPQHPRMKELNAQVADLNGQITAEARKVLDSAEAETKLAAAREDEINRSLADLKAAAARANDAGVQLRALEREAAAQRDLLDSYLRRYREALAREQTDYLPADARVISQAAVSIEPDFPKKVPMTAAVTVMALILAIAFVLLRELASGRPMRRVVFAGPVPMVPDAIPVDGHLRWADDHSVRRMMPSEPTLAPALIDRVEQSLAAIASDIVHREVKRIVVTLAEGCEDDGRPLAAVALARALARTEARVVVVDFRGDDADAVSMGEGGSLPGFTDLVDGEASFAQVIFRDRKSRVHFIPAGQRPLEAELIAGERLETILSALTLTYDYVVLDARDDMIAGLAPGSGVAVVVSEFGAADPRTRSAFDRIKAVSEADIQLLVVDAGSARDEEDLGDGLSRAKERTPAGEAA
jgi:succinoglycan biosynthesis transport protein ExoP